MTPSETTPETVRNNLLRIELECGKIEGMGITLAAAAEAIIGTNAYMMEKKYASQRKALGDDNPTTAKVTLTSSLDAYSMEALDLKQGGIRGNEVALGVGTIAILLVFLATTRKIRRSIKNILSTTASNVTVE